MTAVRARVAALRARLAAAPLSRADWIALAVVVAAWQTGRALLADTSTLAAVIGALVAYPVALWLCATVNRAGLDRAALERVQAGADRSPRDPDTMPTAAQLWAHLLDAHEVQRTATLARLINAAQDGHACRDANHRDRLAYTVMGEDAVPGRAYYSPAPPEVPGTPRRAADPLPYPLIPHAERLWRERHALLTQGHALLAFRVVVPADWPPACDTATVYGMPVTRGDVAEPTLTHPEVCEHETCSTRRLHYVGDHK